MRVQRRKRFDDACERIIARPRYDGVGNPTVGLRALFGLVAFRHRCASLSNKCINRPSTAGVPLRRTRNQRNRMLNTAQSEDRAVAGGPVVARSIRALPRGRISPRLRENFRHLEFCHVRCTYVRKHRGSRPFPRSQTLCTWDNATTVEKLSREANDTSNSDITLPLPWS